MVGCSTSTIDKSFAKGDVVGKTQCGGLVGHFTGVSITDSYAMGNIEGGDFVGGLIGRLFLPLNNSTLNNNIAFGKAKGSDADSTGSFIGGIIITYNEVTYGNLNIINSQFSKQQANPIGNCYTQNNLGLFVLSTYDMSLLLNGLKNSSYRTSLTTLQIGINNNDFSQIQFETSFQFELPMLLEQINSDESLFLIDEFTNLLSEKQTELGSVSNRLESVLDEIATQYDNLVSSRSTLRDADMAELSSTYIQQQILQEASATLMATANQMPAIALQLL